MRSFRIAIAAVLLFNGIAAYAQEKASTPALAVNRVSGDVYMIDNGTTDLNGGGNIAVLIGKDGLVLVDAQSRPSTVQAVMGALKNLSDKPIRYAIDTHCHGDHIGGSRLFQEVGATLIAHENVRRRVEAKKCDNGTFSPPSMTFDNELILRLNDEEMRIIKLPAGHTDGHSMVYFKQVNVVATGDVFISIKTPFNSKYAGGSILGLIESLKMIVGLVPEGAKVIPGHGPQATINDIQHAIKTLEGVKAAIAEQIAKHKKLDELNAAELLSPWRNELGAEQLEFYLRNFYEALQFAL